jgi:dTDP-4-dehydrorhamnose reductase
VRIFVTGNRGQLGQELMRAFPDDEVDGADLPELDITDADLTRRIIEAARPDVVVHCAALTDTTLCERDPDLAQRVNGLGTRNVAQACRDARAALVYVSTNEVFDGLKREPYLESDAPNPINAYGRSKLAGEGHVQALLDRYYIVRTAWLYGGGERDFPAKILAAAAERHELSVVTDEVATPTHARDLAEAIAKLLAKEMPLIEEQDFVQKGALRLGVSDYGVYHFTNAGECSRYDWTREILRLAGRDDVRLTPTTTAALQPFPPKPPYSVLRNDAGAKLGITFRPWQDALAESSSEVR